jgi:hypothetical protein
MPSSPGLPSPIQTRLAGAGGRRRRRHRRHRRLATRRRAAGATARIAGRPAAAIIVTTATTRHRHAGEDQQGGKHQEGPLHFALRKTQPEVVRLQTPGTTSFHSGPGFPRVFTPFFGPPVPKRATGYHDSQKCNGTPLRKPGSGGSLNCASGERDPLSAVVPAAEAPSILGRRQVSRVGGSDNVQRAHGR